MISVYRFKDDMLHSTSANEHNQRCYWPSGVARDPRSSLQNKSMFGPQFKFNFIYTEICNNRQVMLQNEYKKPLSELVLICRKVYL